MTERNHTTKRRADTPAAGQARVQAGRKDAAGRPQSGRPEPLARPPRSGDYGEAYAPRQRVPFACQDGHEFTLTFAADVEVPGQWDCPRCGQTAGRDGIPPAEDPAVKPPLSHWDRLLQRRSLVELESLLAERIRELRAQRG